jgi:hypothetical protein
VSGRWRPAFSSRLHAARVLPHLAVIGRLRNSRTPRGVRKTARLVLSERWHKLRMGIFGWELPTVCIDSTVSSSSAISLSRAAPSRPRMSLRFWLFPMETSGSAFDPERSAFCGRETPRTIQSVKEYQRQGYGVSHRIAKERLGLLPTADWCGWRATDGRKWGKTGISQPGLPTQCFWILKEHFGFLPKTRLSFFHRARAGFNRLVFESDR